MEEYTPFPEIRDGVFYWAKEQSFEDNDRSINL